MHGLNLSRAILVGRWLCGPCVGFMMRSTSNCLSLFATRKTSLFWRRFPLRRSGLVIAGANVVIDKDE